MAKYWVYMNNQVKGPYEVDQLIRLAGFSRATMVSVDDQSGGAGRWISPTDIPELARIFQKVDQLFDAPTPGPRPTPKPTKPRMPTRLTPVAPPAEEPKRYAGAWIIVVFLSLLVVGGLLRWNQILQRQQRAEEVKVAQTMVETVPLPASSLYSSIRQFLQSKEVEPRWDVQGTPSGVYDVTASWSATDPPGQVSVYSFEANLQAQSVRGLNTAAIRLLSDGFVSAVPKPAHTAANAPAKKSPGDFFPSAISDRRQAFEQGDFDTVWETFSHRRKNEMAQGGITSAGFVQMQKMTYRPGSEVKQTIIKTKAENEKTRLVLLRQAQPKHPDIYVKQTWIWEDDAWRLDNEEKKVANAALPPTSETAPTDRAPAQAPAPQSRPPPTAKPIPAGLPGFSDTSKTP